MAVIMEPSMLDWTGRWQHTYRQLKSASIGQGLGRGWHIDEGLLRAAEVRGPVYLGCEILSHLASRHKHLHMPVKCSLPQGD